MDFERLFRSAGYVFFAYRDGYKDLLAHKKVIGQSILLPIDQAESRTFKSLKKILLHAYKTSVYYRRCWNELGFDPEQVRGVNDLSQLPVLTKDILEKYSQEIISSWYDVSDLELSVTGGTSGRQSSFYRDYACSTAKRGRQLGILEQCGYPLGTRCGLVWGVHDDLPSDDMGLGLKRKARKFASGNETFCCTTMDEDRLMDYYKRLRKFKPKLIYGYPNAILHLGNFVSMKKLEPIYVDKIFCTAESLKSNQREQLSKIFNAEVYNLYCTREHGCIGFECYQHNGFHIDSGSVLVEVLKNGSPAPTGEVGDLVITDLINYGMPFIRNKIGDRGALSLQPCACGCQLPMLRSLDGRVTDTLHLPDGQIVSGLMLTDMFVNVQTIRKFQIVQKTINEFHLNMVVTREYSSETEERVLKEAREYLREGVDIKVNLFPDIPNNPLSGKFQEVISEITIN